MTGVYTPIACIDHERLEYAVLKRQGLLLRYLDPTGNEVSVSGLAVDVYTAEQAEWLEFLPTGGAQHRIRLDHILLVTVA